jgi:hypothetical protein
MVVQTVEALVLHRLHLWIQVVVVALLHLWSQVAV